MALSLKTVLEYFNLFKANFESFLNQDAPVNDKAYMNAESAVYAAVSKGHNLYAAERAKQNLALTATGDDLDNIGLEYDVIRSPAEAAQLEIELPGINGTIIPAGTDFVGDSNGERYFSDAAAVIAGGIAVIDITAEDVGDAGNLIIGTDTLSIGRQIAGAETVADVTDILNIGLDKETDESYRPRILTVIRATRGGGNATDYKIWAEGVAGVERAFPISGKPIEILQGDGITWLERASASDSNWRSIAYSPELNLFCAIADSGAIGSRIMTSPDGIHWTSRTASVASDWQSVTWGNGLFVAVADSGVAAARIMTSPDGINWTSRTAPNANDYRSVCYGDGLFVAVSITGALDRVMTSPDGINWTARTTPNNNNYYAVTYGGGLYVAVSTSGVGNRVMTSTDGVTWSAGVSAADLLWRDIVYSSEIDLFVAVASDGILASVMTSPDGLAWTIRNAASVNQWFGVCYGNGIFTAVSVTGALDRVMTSPDGINWTARTTPNNNNFIDIIYGNGTFVSVSNTGTGDRVMTNGYVSFTSDRTVYIEAESSIDPDGIAPQSLLDDVRDAINNDPDTGRSRPPLGLTDSTLYVSSISRTDFYTNIDNIQIDPNNLAAAQSDIEDALDLYYAGLSPYLDGIDVILERNDKISDMTLSRIVQDVLSSYGAVADNVSFGLSAGVFDQNTYTLAPGELAKNTAVTYS
jgi:hypothetical protein